MGGRLSTEALGLSVISILLLSFGLLITIGALNVFNHTARGVASAEGVNKIVTITTETVNYIVQKPFSNSNNYIAYTTSIAVYVPAGTYLIGYNKTTGQFYLESIQTIGNKTKTSKMYFGVRGNYDVENTIYSNGKPVVKKVEYKTYMFDVSPDNPTKTVSISFDKTTTYNIQITVVKKLTGTSPPEGVIQVTYTITSAEGNAIIVG